MFEFIKEEIVEARMFTGTASISKHSLSGLSRILYLNLLTLEILRYTDLSTAQHYANLTLQYGDFNHMRGSGTDLANLLAVLSNQSDYEDRLDIDDKIVAPVLQTKSYLRGVWQLTPRGQHSRDRMFFMGIETQLGINDSMLWSIRRGVLDWEQLNSHERHQVLSNMRREIQRHAMRMDLAEYLPKH
jgi:hypothetical protein